MLGVSEQFEIGFKIAGPGAPLQMFTTANGKVFIAHEAATYATQQCKEFQRHVLHRRIDAIYTISLQDDKLVLRRKNIVGGTPLVGQFAGAFSAAGSGGIRRHQRRSKPRRRFLLPTDRVRNLRFARAQP